LAITYWALATCHLLLGRVDQAIDLLQTARAANPRLWVPYLYLAGAYGLKGDIDKAKAALAVASGSWWKLPMAGISGGDVIGSCD
jgi:predicted Zn-dependent protease